MLREWRDRKERRLREMNVKWWKEKVRRMMRGGKRRGRERARKGKEDRQGREKVVWRGVERENREKKGIH